MLDRAERGKSAEKWKNVKMRRKKCDGEGV
jgi:hypothetical protein